MKIPSQIKKHWQGLTDALWKKVYGGIILGLLALAYFLWGWFVHLLIRTLLIPIPHWHTQEGLFLLSLLVPFFLLFFLIGKQTSKKIQITSVAPPITQVQMGLTNDETFASLCQAEKTLLKRYVMENTKTIILPSNDGTAIGLVRRGILYIASTLEDFKCHYNIEEWAWRYSQLHPDTIK